jgi:hypothetical protein
LGEAVMANPTGGGGWVGNMKAQVEPTQRREQREVGGDERLPQE